MRTVSKGKIFGFTTEISDELLAKLKQTPEILQKANAVGAEYWHEGILPGHFEKSAHSKYGYATRARNYLKQAKKGSKPDLVFSGSMRQEMIHNRQITSTATGAKLKLRARVLNLIPNIADNNQDLYVTHNARNGSTRTYPNLKREVKAIVPDEREAVAKAVAESYQNQMKRTT